MKKQTYRLTSLQEQFVDCYFNSNFNGSMAILKLKPQLTPGSAATIANRMLNNVEVQKAIELKKEIIRSKSEIKLEDNIAHLNRLIYELQSEASTNYDADGKQIAKRDNNALIKAIDMLNRLAGYYAPVKQDLTSNGEKIVPEIKINIIPPKQDGDDNNK